MTKKILKELELKLKETKASLEEQLQSFAKKDPNVKDDWDSRFPKFDHGDMEEAADEVEEYSTRLPIEHSLELKLRDVNLALEKINPSASSGRAPLTGSGRVPSQKLRIKKIKYGVCEKCGKPIPQKRLIVSPEAKLCMKCQE